MSIRLLIVEPDREVLDSHASYFRRLANFSVDPVTDLNTFVVHINTFCPDVLMFEPEHTGGAAVLDQIEIPVIVLSRFSGDEILRSHPAIAEDYVKPKSLDIIRERIEQLAASH